MPYQVQKIKNMRTKMIIAFLIATILYTTALMATVKNLKETQPSPQEATNKTEILIFK